jgi:preprotein translocase subunit SecG
MTIYEFSIVALLIIATLFLIRKKMKGTSTVATAPAKVGSKFWKGVGKVFSSLLTIFIVICIACWVFIQLAEKLRLWGYGNPSSSSDKKKEEYITHVPPAKQPVVVTYKGPGTAEYPAYGSGIATKDKPLKLTINVNHTWTTPQGKGKYVGIDYPHQVLYDSIPNSDECRQKWKLLMPGRYEYYPLDEVASLEWGWQ